MDAYEYNNVCIGELKLQRDRDIASGKAFVMPTIESVIRNKADVAREVV